MITLAIDASTYRGTVAVFRDRLVAASMEATMRGASAEALMPAVAETMARAGIGISDLDRVVCGEGPGSFTSLRIAASISKGISLGAAIPLFAVSSLGLVVATAADGPGRWIATIDALRDEWYAAVFERDAAGQVASRSPVALVAKGDIDAYSASMQGVVAGAARGRVEPSASACAALFPEIEARGPVDLERWEPSYGRLAEAQVKWEAAHGRPLSA